MRTISLSHTPQAFSAKKPAMNLKELTIVEARAHMVKGTFSATEYVTELLRSEPDAVSLNAFVARDTGQMLKEAVAADASGASRNAAKLLAGIPIALKDNINTTGLPTTGCTGALKGKTPTENAPVARQLFDAGAILAGKNNMHELALGITNNNALSFIHATLDNLGPTKVGLFRADSGFYDKAIVCALEEKHISYIISAKMTQGLQQAIVDHCKWQIVEPGIEVSELDYHPTNWDRPKRIVVVRQHISRRANVPGKTLSLFKDDEDLMGWRYGAMITDLGLAAIEIWRLYRGRADCENRIKELKYDFGLDSFVMRNFWATEAALSVVMLAYNLMSVFRQAVIRQKSHQTLATLHHKVLAMGAYWGSGKEESERPTLNLAVARQRRPWFEGLWANANEPVEWSYRPHPA